MSAPAPEENLMNLGDRLLWGMENYGVSTELFGATAYVGFNLVLDPKDNYFYCDGTADDVQINAAEAYVTALGGGSVVLEAGTYDIVDPIIPTGSNIHYKGQGAGTILDGDGLATTEHVFHVTNQTEIEITDMAMQTENGGDKTCHCIFIEDGANNFHIKDVTIIDSDDNGIHIEGTTITQGHIHDCHFASTDGHAIYVNMDGANYMYRLHIGDCDIIDAGNAGIYFDASAGNSNFVIVNNVIFSPSGIGIYVTGGNRGLIRGNQCLTSANLSGVHVAASSEIVIDNNICNDNDRFGIYLTVTTNSLVTGNICNGNDASDAASYDGINLDSSSTDNIVSGNQCEGNHRYGIYSDGARNLVNGNSVLNNDRSGIVIGDVDNEVSGNTLYDDGQDAAGTYHELLVEAAGLRTLITGNHISSPGDSSEDCIHLADGATHALIEANYCDEGMGSGIALTANNDDCSILGNYLMNNDDYGVEISAGTCDRARVHGNIFVGNVTGAVLNSGTDTVFHTFQYYVARDDDNVGVVPGKSITNGQTAYIAVHAPLEMAQLMGFHIHVIPNATQANADWDLETDYGGEGEAYNTHEETEAAATYNVTNNQWFAIDAFAAGMFASLEAEDIGGISLTVGTATHNVTVVMAELYYV